MVKKLLKHEFIYYIRTLGIFLPWVIPMALFVFFLRAFDNGSIVMDIALPSAYAFLILTCIALIMFCSILGIVRFYKNMYSAEGYLTFTLPVSNAQHIFVKLLTSLTATLVGWLLCALSLLIAFAGIDFFNYLSLFFTNIIYGLAKIPVVHAVFYTVEITLITLVSLLSMPLLYYACISIGQLAKKNRILLAIGAYFIYSMISRVFSTALSIVLSIFTYTPVADVIGDFIAASPFASVHILLNAVLLFTAAVTALFFFITLYIMNKKLNLE